MDKNKVAKQYLLRDRLLNIDMLEALRRGSAELLAASPSGVLLRVPTVDGGSTYQLSADTPERASELLDLVREDEPYLLFTVHQDFAAEITKERFRLDGENKCYQCLYEDADRPLPEGLEFRPLQPCHAALAASHYYGRIEYVRERINAGMLFGAFADGELAGFMGIHSEGSTGMLEVLPAYRRRGIGSALETYLFRIQREWGWTPYGNVIFGNEASEALQRKMGLRFAASPVWWLFRTDDREESYQERDS
jgi:tRNA (guanine37-N1)-methyltransferase